MLRLGLVARPSLSLAGLAALVTLAVGCKAGAESNTSAFGSADAADDTAESLGDGDGGMKFATLEITRPVRQAMALKRV